MPLRPPRSEERLELQHFTGRRIRQARDEADLTQGELATELGFSHSWLSNIELGLNGLDAHDLLRIARVLENYPIEWYLSAESGRSRRRPRSRRDWESLYPERPDIARLHWDLDKAAKLAVPVPEPGPSLPAARLALHQELGN
jgi:transcriptional regulator with XRE-family HTH domain